MQTIDSFSGKYRFLSNFYVSPFNLDGYRWKTTEHYFQAIKTLDLDDRMEILEQATPGQAKKKGRKVTLRKDWDEIKDSVMYEAIKAKFTQNPELRNKLIDTGDAELIEGNHWGDTYWGVCKGKGKNKLGKLLMQLREELKKEVK